MRFPLILLILFIISSCSNKPEQEASSSQPELVDTSSKPTTRQWKGIWGFADSTVFFSNTFDGARLNGVIEKEENNFVALIAAENYPINPSPWYAFQVWSKEPKKITIQLTYQDSRSRYYPKISTDGMEFLPMDSSRVTSTAVEDSSGWGLDSVPLTTTISLDIDESPVWISAQELWNSARVQSWIDLLASEPDANQYPVGKSVEGRAIQMLDIGSEEAEKAILIISRQHPPEVTGFLAMKTFMETIAGKSDLARNFRSKFRIFNVPLMNPDGVDNGNWRHNTGGIDLNRDWQSFHQPETGSIKRFLESKTEEGLKFVFAADFHSTWQDIYYPLDSTVVEEDALFVFEWINRISERVNQQPNVSASKHVTPTMVSRNYFYQSYSIPSIVFELGDNVDRAFISEKGRVAAEELMLILLDQKE
ncbi:MAG: hypothetical protein HRT61_05245 [Ekhidna sp.]|nr:hypothetical protein [Ekhidna sp.]